MNYQILIDKEQSVLRKNTLSSLEDGSEINRRISTHPDKRVDFLLCPSYFWCASYFNFGELSMIGALFVIITAWNNYQYQQDKAELNKKNYV